MPEQRTTRAIVITATALAALAAATATYSTTTYKRLPLVVGTLAVLTVLAVTYATLSTRELALLAATIAIPALVAIPVVVPVLGAPNGLLTLAAAYVLAVAATAACWHWRDRPPNRTETMVVATLVVVALAPLSRWLVVPDPTGPGVDWQWVALHLVRTVPLAFALPLGVAETDEQQVGPALAVFLGWVAAVAAYLAAIGTLLAPGVAIVSAMALLSLAAGGPLFVLGRHLARAEGPLGGVNGWKRTARAD